MTTKKTFFNQIERLSILCFSRDLPDFTNKNRKINYLAIIIFSSIIIMAFSWGFIIINFLIHNFK